MSWNFEPYEYPAGVIPSLNGQAIDPNIRLEEYTDSNGIWAFMSKHGLGYVLKRQIWAPIPAYLAPFFAHLSHSYNRALGAAKSDVQTPSNIKIMEDVLDKLVWIAITGAGIVPTPWLNNMSVNRLAFLGIAGFLTVLLTW